MRAAIGVTLYRGFAATLIPLCALISVAQQKQEISYRVDARAVLSVTNNYGPITIKPAARPGEVLITMIFHSKGMTLDNEQHDNRIQLRAVSLLKSANFAEFTLLVPSDACVTLRSSGGALRAEGLQGDLIFETITGALELKNIRDSHIHVHDLSGPTTLAGIRNSRLDVNSFSGDIILRDISGSSAVVHSGRGRIVYEGDPGTGGDYRLTTQTGDVEVSIPATSPAIISASSASVKSPASSDVAKSPPSGKEILLSKSQVSKASVFVLHSLRGKISVLRP